MGNRGFCQFALIGVSLLLAACSADLVELPGFGSGSGSATVAPAGGGYRAYAVALLAEPRSDVKFRPDLESYRGGHPAQQRLSGGCRRRAHEGGGARPGARHGAWRLCRPYVAQWLWLREAG